MERAVKIVLWARAQRQITGGAGTTNAGLRWGVTASG
jgi:hypothetical protein